MPTFVYMTRCDGCVSVNVQFDDDVLRHHRWRNVVDKNYGHDTDVARGNLGLSLVDRGEPEQAVVELLPLVDSYREQGEYRLTAQARFNLAYAHHHRGDHAAARKLGTEALRELELINDPTAHHVREQLSGWTE